MNQQLGHRGKFSGGADDLIEGKDGMWAVCFRNLLNQDEREIRLIFTQYGDVGPIRSSGVWTFVRFHTEAEARASMEDPGIQSSLGDAVKAARCTKNELSGGPGGNQDDAKKMEPSPNNPNNPMLGNVGGQGNFNNRGGFPTNSQNLSNKAPMNQQYGQINRQYPPASAVDNTSNSSPAENAPKSAPAQNDVSSAPAGNDSKSTTDSNSTAAAGPTGAGKNSSESSGSNRPFTSNQGRPYQGNNTQPGQGNGRPQYPPRGGYLPSNQQSYRFPPGGQQPRRYPGQYGGPNQEAQNNPNNQDYFTEGGMPARGPPRQYGGPYQGNNGQRFGNRGPQNQAEGGQANQYYQNNQPRGPPPGAYEADQQGFNPYHGDSRKPGFNQNRARNAKQFPHHSYVQNDLQYTGGQAGSFNNGQYSAEQEFRRHEGPKSSTQEEKDFAPEGVQRNTPDRMKRSSGNQAQSNDSKAASKAQNTQSKSPNAPEGAHSIEVNNLARLNIRQRLEEVALTRTVRNDNLDEEEVEEYDETLPELDYDEELEEEWDEDAYTDIIIANYPKDYSEDDLWEMCGEGVQHLTLHSTDTMRYCNVKVASPHKMRELLAIDNMSFIGKRLIVRLAEDLIAIGLNKTKTDRVATLKQNALGGKKPLKKTAHQS